MLTLAKVREAVVRIREFSSAYNARAYVAYSGGKDSLATVYLERLAGTDLPRVHNCHPGECAELPALRIKPPKYVNVPAFLSAVDLAGQIDGTRRDEDKTVIFDGVEIHRSKMPTWATEKGVFGLAVCFPLWDWTEQEVFEFIDIYPSLFEGR